MACLCFLFLHKEAQVVPSPARLPRIVLCQVLVSHVAEAGYLMGACAVLDRSPRRRAPALRGLPEKCVAACPTKLGRPTPGSPRDITRVYLTKKTCH